LARDGNFSGFGNSIWDFPIFLPSEGIPIPRERGTRTGPYNLDFWEREYPFANPIRWGIPSQMSWHGMGFPWDLPFPDWPEWPYYNLWGSSRSTK
jgi:hypothetical protein